jgi:hypothetical protein
MIHHHKYKLLAKQKAHKLRKRGLNVTIVQYSDKTYGVYSYRDGK